MKEYDAFDIETTGLSPYHGARTFAYCHGTMDTGIKVVRGDQMRGELIRYFLNTRKAKIAHNMKFELSFMSVEKIPMPEETEWHDTMIMSQMLRNDAMSHALDKLADVYCDDESLKKYWRDIDKRVDQQATARGDGPGSKRFDRVDTPLMTEYQINDGDRTLLLFHLFEDELRSDPRMWSDYLNEIKLVRVTQRMEERGIKLHRANAERLIKWMQDEVDKVRERTFELLGEYVNLNSPDQIARILFKTLNLPILQFTTSGKPQTDKDVLLMLREKHPHELIDLIFQHRAYTKGIPIVQGYIDAADTAGMIHANIKTNHAGTGRQSCSNPNLQNVAKEESFKTPYPIPARECFANEPKHILLLPDYSGIEMRLGVQGTRSERLKKLLFESFDFHAACAEAFYGERFTTQEGCFAFVKQILPAVYEQTRNGNDDETAYKKLKSMLRSSAKNARFAMFYGAGLGQTARTLRLPVDEVKLGYAADREMFPEFYDFMGRNTAHAKQFGYVETFFGRKLRVPHDRPYASTDYVIQGSAAGVLKRAEIALDEYFEFGLDCKVKLLLPIHDEIVMKYPRSMLGVLGQKAARMEEIMTTFPEIDVHLEVEWKYTDTVWSKAKKFDPKKEALTAC